MNYLYARKSCEAPYLLLRMTSYPCRLERYSLLFAEQSGDGVRVGDKAKWRHLTHQAITQLSVLLSPAPDVSALFALNTSKLSNLAMNPRGRST
jgi:hypothetical protein